MYKQKLNLNFVNMRFAKVLNRNFILVISLIALMGTLTLTGCKSKGKGSDESDSLKDFDSDVVKKVERVFYTLPSPFELAQMLKRAGAKYIFDILNPVENVHKYSTEKSKALNLGVYGADLSYASIYDQTQETMLFLSCSKELSDGLGISSALKQTLIDRIEQNIDNRDSLLQIISDSFYDTDEFLKQNERPTTAVLVLVGGWIEGLHIATRLAEITKDNKEIIQRIGEQKYSLDNVVALMEVYAEHPNIHDLYIEMKDLKKIYDEAEVVKEDANAEAAPNAKGKEVKKVTTVGATSSVHITNDQLKAITKKIKEIRAKIVE